MAYGETRTKVTTMTIRGTEYPVELRVYTRHEGPPSADFRIPGLTAGRNQSEVSADTLEDLYKRGMEASKQNAVKIAIPVTRVAHQRGSVYSRRSLTSPQDRYMEHGTIVGLHKGNGNLLVKWGDAPRPEQETNRYNLEHYYRPMAQEDEKKFLALLAEQSKVEAAIEEISDRYRIDSVDQVVEAEIERVASETVDVSL